MKNMHVSLEEISGGFANLTHYNLCIRIVVSQSQPEGNPDQEKEARINAQKILDERFPEAKINVEEIFMTKHFSF